MNRTLRRIRRAVQRLPATWHWASDALLMAADAIDEALREPGLDGRHRHELATIACLARRRVSLLHKASRA